MTGRIEIVAHPDGFAVIARKDDVEPPLVSPHAIREHAISVALTLQRSPEFAGAKLVDKASPQNCGHIRP